MFFDNMEMKVMMFNDRVQARLDLDAYICVGLDPNWDKIPFWLKREHARSDLATNEETTAILHDICCMTVDATHQYAAAFKPNSAFFERHGSAGLLALERVITHIRQVAPSVPIILDGNRNCIGDTCAQYAAAAFEHLQVDAVTVNPYLGFEALSPYFHEKYSDRGIIVLCKTSNPGGDEFQNLRVRLNRAELAENFGGSSALKLLGNTNAERIPVPLYKLVAGRVDRYWNQPGRNCWLVVAATYPQELQEILDIVQLPILLPGFGNQGALVEDIIPLVRDRLCLPNSSSGIMFAYKPENEGGFDREQSMAASAAKARAFNESIAALAV